MWTLSDQELYEQAREAGPGAEVERQIQQESPSSSRLKWEEQFSFQPFGLSK